MSNFREDNVTLFTIRSALTCKTCSFLGDRQKTAFLTSKMSNFCESVRNCTGFVYIFPKGESGVQQAAYKCTTHKIALYFKCIEEPGVDYWLYCAQAFRSLKSANLHDNYA
jgi:hypothetical protein